MHNFKYGDIVTPIHDSVYSKYGSHIEGNFMYIEDRDDYIHIKTMFGTIDRLVESCEMQLLIKEVEEYSLTF